MKTLPHDPIYPIESASYGPMDGLTKREYFAAIAMQGLLINYRENGMYGNHYDYPMVEAAAVRCADQLIDELNKTTP